MNKYYIIRSADYDWIALYKDGKLLRQGHSIQEEDMLALLDLPYYHLVATDKQFEDWGGQCPARLEANFS